MDAIEAIEATEEPSPDGSVDASVLACSTREDSKRVPCDACGHPMEPEHAHYRCPACHYIQPCCGW